MGGNAPHLGHADAETRKRLLRASGFALCMPMVNASLKVLYSQKRISTAPGENALQLDAATRAAVKDFQGKNGLDADGIPGQNTQKKLAEVVAGLGGGAAAPAPAAHPGGPGAAPAPA